jgi:hypothetical protein
VLADQNQANIITYTNTVRKALMLPNLVEYHKAEVCGIGQQRRCNGGKGKREV